MTRRTTARKRDRAKRGLLAAVLAVCPVRGAWANEKETAAPPPPELLYEMRLAMSPGRSGLFTAGPVLGPMFPLDERNALGVTVAADLWLGEEVAAISLGPGLRYRHRLGRDLDWSVSGESVWFPQAGYLSMFRRVETSVTVARAVVLGVRAEQAPGGRLHFSGVVGASGEHGAVLTVLGVLGLVLLVASVNDS